MSIEQSPRPRHSTLHLSILNSFGAAHCVAQCCRWKTVENHQQSVSKAPKGRSFERTYTPQRNPPSSPCASPDPPAAPSRARRSPRSGASSARTGRSGRILRKKTTRQHSAPKQQQQNNKNKDRGEQAKAKQLYPPPKAAQAHAVTNNRT